MGRFVKGDIVVLSYPFSDFSGVKRRPALVIADLDGDDVILCQITSLAKTDKYALELKNEDFIDGKLNVNSVVRPNKIFTADSNIILYTACKISVEKTDIVINAITDIIIVMSGDVVGDEYDAEIAELTRVCKSGGWLLDFPSDASEDENEENDDLTERGWEAVGYGKSRKQIFK
jgi:mRNA interferase MazF